MKVLIAWVPLFFVLWATYHDLRTREIPDAIPLALLGWAVVATALRFHAVGWWSLLGGLALGLLLSSIFFALGGLGGGDVKLIAALGAALGPGALLPVLFGSVGAGGPAPRPARARLPAGGRSGPADLSPQPI
jgi:prepilin peptidase CpaA